MTLGEHPPSAPFSPVTIDEELCIGCNLCLFVCEADLYLPNPVKGRPPMVTYGGECWYEGSCVDYCPVPGAITLHGQLFNQVNGKEAGGPDATAAASLPRRTTA